MKPYSGHMYYKLYRALQDEGIPEKDMVFEDEITMVSDLGFFTIRIVENIAQVVHFLVWPEKRVWHNSIRLYRDIKNILIDLGFVSFIAASPVGHKSWPQLFCICGGKKSVKLYAEKDNIQYYVINFGRHIQ